MAHCLRLSAHRHGNVHAHRLLKAANIKTHSLARAIRQHNKLKEEAHACEVHV